VKPTAYIPPALYPESSAPDKVPAFVLEIPAAKIVRLWHKDGMLHTNAQRCIQRYKAKGWRVEIVTDKAALVVPLSIPVTRRAA
jgi:hypothetical protein